MALIIKEAREAHQKVADSLLTSAQQIQDLAKELRKLNPSVIGTLARGSSDHAVTYFSYLAPAVLGRVVASLPPSLTTVLNSQFRLQNQVVITVSQSGSSPDILKAMNAAKAGGALCIGISNEPESPLAKSCDHFLWMGADKELGLAATKTVLCTQAKLAQLVAEWSQDQKLCSELRNLPQVMKESFELGASMTKSFLADASHVYVLSRALGMTAAYEIALKIKETCGIHAEAFSSAEVRHGPKEIVNANYRVIGIALPESDFEDVITASLELKALGAEVLLLSPQTIHASQNHLIQGHGGQSLRFVGSEDSRLNPICALQAFYPWVANQARAIGRDPDHPRVLTQKVVHTL